VNRPIAVLRPEPGNRVTAAAIEARGRIAIRLPLFEVRPLAWQVPDPDRFDALVLTSANAIRHGGPGLAALLGLPIAGRLVEVPGTDVAGIAITVVGAAVVAIGVRAAVRHSRLSLLALAPIGRSRPRVPVSR